MEGPRRPKSPLDRFFARYGGASSGSGTPHQRISRSPSSALSIGTDISLRRILFPSTTPDPLDICEKVSFTATDLYTTPILRSPRRRILDLTTASTSSVSTLPINPSSESSSIDHTIMPSLVLDAPNMLDDFYLNVLSWGAQNLLAVGLADTIYLWNAGTQQISQLCQTGNLNTERSNLHTSQSGATQLSMERVMLRGGGSPIEDVYVSSVHFINNTSWLAVGYSNGIVQVWDTTTQKMLHQLEDAYLDGLDYLEQYLFYVAENQPTQESVQHQLPPSNRVASLASLDHPNLLSTGCRLGDIRHYDLRASSALTSNVSYTAQAPTFQLIGSTQNSTMCHEQEVCGLEWKDGLLASGGNDNMVFVWDIRKHSGFQQPLLRLDKHTSAIKALGWCPWKRHTLATGGGSMDKRLCIWNTAIGTCTESTQTEAQICCLKWSTLSSELVTGHGYAKNELVVWAWPKLIKLLHIPAHNRRILHMARSPDGTTIVSTAYDENLKFWRLFDFVPDSNDPNSYHDVKEDYNESDHSTSSSFYDSEHFSMSGNQSPLPR
jgi:WD40 repeat protein